MPFTDGDFVLNSRKSPSARRATVTRNDVAALAGVAPSTVSYVVNNGPRSVSLKVREKVLKAIAKLAYQPSAVARSLRTRRTQTVGLVIPDITNPYYGEMAQAVEELSFEHGYTVILADSSHLPERELKYAQVLRSKQVDGVIFLPVTPQLEALHVLQGAGIPVVVLERFVPGYPCIMLDEHFAGFLATQHLIELGHRRIGCIALEADSTSSAVRLEGYRSALVGAGILPDKDLVVVGGADGYSAGEAEAHRFLHLPQRPTAVVAHNDLVAIGAMKAFAEAGLKIPDDISVVGFDDIAAASYVQPPLTTIACPKGTMGKAAMDLLLNLMHSDELITPCAKKLEVEIIVRGSTSRLG